MAESSNWLAQFPELARLQDERWHTASAQAVPLTLPAGVPVFREGDACNNFLLVLDGSVRVQKLSEGGREIVLYRVSEGQSCILTTACLLGGQRYNAEAYSENEVRAVAIPYAAFQQAMHGSQGFREFVFSAYAQRMTELLMLIDAITFGRIEPRLANHLLQLSDDQGVVRTTHQELARELGSAREVISRMLKDFERRSLVQLNRGAIVLQDRTALAEVGR